MVGGGGEELGAVVVVAGCGGGSGAGRGRGLLLLLLSRCLVSNCSGSPPCWLELAYLAQIGVGGAVRPPVLGQKMGPIYKKRPIGEHNSR